MSPRLTSPGLLSRSFFVPLHLPPLKANRVSYMRQIFVIPRVKTVPDTHIICSSHLSRRFSAASRACAKRKSQRNPSYLSGVSTNSSITLPGRSSSADRTLWSGRDSLSVVTLKAEHFRGQRRLRLDSVDGENGDLAGNRPANSKTRSQNRPESLRKRSPDSLEGSEKQPDPPRIRRDQYRADSTTTGGGGEDRATIRRQEARQNLKNRRTGEPSLISNTSEAAPFPQEQSDSSSPFIPKNTTFGNPYFPSG
jgi:hypothetical protein